MPFDVHLKFRAFVKEIMKKSIIQLRAQKGIAMHYQQEGVVSPERAETKINILPDVNGCRSVKFFLARVAGVSGKPSVDLKK